MPDLREALAGVLAPVAHASNFPANIVKRGSAGVESTDCATGKML
jgi:hypothetical protein